MTDVEQPTRNEGFRISQLPATMRNSALALVKEFDADGDGKVDSNEFADAVKALKDSRDKTKSYAKVITGLSVSGILLIASIFGVSLVAARLSKDTSIGDFGVMLDKSTKSPVKTSEATEYFDEATASLKIVDMTSVQLMHLKHIVLFGGDVLFHVKGHTRSPAGDKVIILVEGGTITYNKEGIFDATGDPRYMLDVAFGVSEIEDSTDDSTPEVEGDETGDRKLWGYYGLAMDDATFYYKPARGETFNCRRDLREELGDARWRRLCGGGSSTTTTSSSTSTSSETAQTTNVAKPEPEPKPERSFASFGFDPIPQSCVASAPYGFGMVYYC